MSALTDQILTHLELRALDEEVRIDCVDEFIAAELGVPVAGLYAYLLLCFAAERYAIEASEAATHAEPASRAR